MKIRSSVALAGLCLLSASAVHSAVDETAIDPTAIFTQRCANCHVTAGGIAPRLPALQAMSPESVLSALEVGVMRVQGNALSATERQQLAEYLAGRKLSQLSQPAASSFCQHPHALNLQHAALWSGWSPALDNTRMQPLSSSGLSVEKIPQLRLLWAFGFPNDIAARALPAYADGQVFVGSQHGRVYALDGKTGCTLWTFQAEGGVRTGIVIGKDKKGRATVYFGDSNANAYAVDGNTGTLRWRKKLDTHPNAQILGTPSLYEGRLYVPMSSTEETSAVDPNYVCCSFRGSVSALDASSGTVLWKTYTLDGPIAPVGKRPNGATLSGPAGSAIWSAPTIDPKRGVLYVGTGNQYTSPAQPYSDAILAIALKTGKKVWAQQLTARDFQNPKCNKTNDPDCDEVRGPDVDFGNAPMLVTRGDGKQLLIAGQKSGVGWALDPDHQGARVWDYRAGKGSSLGGMQWGSAADREHAYFPVADLTSTSPGGLHAVDLLTGQPAWVAPPAKILCDPDRWRCSPALSAAITVAGGAVFTGAIDGGIRAYATNDGRLLWEYNSNQSFTTVNGVVAQGGSINGPGPMVADGMLFIGSGYGNFRGRPGNVLLAFGLEESCSPNCPPTPSTTAQ